MALTCRWRSRPQHQQQTCLSRSTQPVAIALAQASIPLLRASAAMAGLVWVKTRRTPGEQIYSGPPHIADSSTSPRDVAEEPLTENVQERRKEVGAAPARTDRLGGESAFGVSD
jgi:hypothetical protein